MRLAQGSGIVSVVGTVTHGMGITRPRALAAVGFLSGLGCLSEAWHLPISFRHKVSSSRLRIGYAVGHPATPY